MQLQHITKLVEQIPFIWILSFVFIPLILLYSDITLDQIISVVNNPIYIKALNSSVIISSAATIICIFIGYTIAFSITKMHNQQTQKFIIFMILLSFFTSNLTKIQILSSLIVNNDHILSSNLPIITSILALTYMYIPIPILIIYASISSIPQELIYITINAGYDHKKVFIKTILPMSAPSIAASAMLIFIPMLTEISLPHMLGASRLNLGYLIWAKCIKSLEYNFAVITALTVYFLTIPIIIMYYLINRKYSQKK